MSTLDDIPGEDGEAGWADPDADDDADPDAEGDDADWDYDD